MKIETLLKQKHTADCKRVSPTRADYLEHLQKVSDATEQHRVDVFALRALRQVDPNETFTEEQKKNFLVFFQTTKN